MISIFIDANIFLDFYRLGEDDITQMKKLTAAIKGSEVFLYTNSLLRAEIERNRERELSKALKDFRATQLSLKLPAFLPTANDFENLVENIKTTNSCITRMAQKIETLIEKKELEADVLINDLFDASNDMAIDDALIERARLRNELGHPPGKKASIGDQVHWECLLGAKPFNLCIISRDGDFASAIDPSRPHSFLTNEWKRNEKPRLYSSLARFFATELPEIELSAEAEKTELIRKLALSRSFVSTHAIISELDQYAYFTTAQVGELFKILVENGQVHRIASDSDVNAFYMKLQEKAHSVPMELQPEAAEKLGVDEISFFIPF